MAARKKTAKAAENKTTDAVLRRHAEDLYADEHAALVEADDRSRPPGWNLSP